MSSLLTLYRVTGKEKYLKPIPSAPKYYSQSVLPDGQLARFYELKTNNPLYFTKSYKLTYSDSDLPAHYRFKVKSKLDRIQQQSDQLKARGPDRKTSTQRIIKPLRYSRSLEQQAAAGVYQDPLAARSPHFTPRAKRVIFLFMKGGPPTS